MKINKKLLSQDQIKTARCFFCQKSIVREKMFMLPYHSPTTPTFTEKPLL